jgi:hypothetical protein
MSTGTNQQRLIQNNTKIDEITAIARTLPDVGSTPNIFAQTTEPETKKGIWLKTDKTVEHYINDTSLKRTWSLPAEETSYPLASVNINTNAIAIGTDIYIFDRRKNFFKYNTITKTYTTLTSFLTGDTANVYRSAAVGTDIYMFGTKQSVATSIKYDTLTDTVTSISDFPTTSTSGRAVAVGTDIYIISCAPASGGANFNYKYNTLTDTYTEMSDNPDPVAGDDIDSGAGIVAIGTDIYITGQNVVMRKYDTLTDTYTRLTSCIGRPFSRGSTAAIGTDIYIFGSSIYTKLATKYDTLTDTYTALESVPLDTSNGACCAIGNTIYCIGRRYTTMLEYRVQNPQYNTDNSIVIGQGDTNNTDYGTILFNTAFETSYQPLQKFADVWFYTTQDGLSVDIPTYYGDGTNWVNIKNPPSTV